MEKAKELYQEAAGKGCTLAMNYLGSLAFNQEKDLQSAIHFFWKAVDSKKCPRALNNLAICYELGSEEYAKLFKEQPLQGDEMTGLKPV